mgnify:FL=1
MLIYFNSIKVRLELETMLEEELIKIFQFHKGAIRTLKTERMICVLIIFQFHKGAIRTFTIQF